MDSSSPRRRRPSNGKRGRHRSRSVCSPFPFFIDVDFQREEESSSFLSSSSDSDHRHRRRRRHRRTHDDDEISPKRHRSSDRPSSSVCLPSSSDRRSREEMEMRMQSLTSQLSRNEKKIDDLRSELRSVDDARIRAERAVYGITAEKNRLQTNSVDLLQVLETLEKSLHDAQKSCGELKEENQRLQQDADTSQLASMAVKEQNEYLTNRNQTLLAKCEKLIAENHLMASRKDESAKELAELKPKMDAIQDDFTKISEEIRKLKERLRSSEENNRVLKNEKSDLEKRMALKVVSFQDDKNALKDAIIIADRKTMDDLKKQIQQEKTESAKKSGLTTSPNMKVVLETEALKEAIETVKLHFEEKISTLTDKVNGINKAPNNKQNPLVRPNGLHQKSEKPDHCGSAPPSPFPDDDVNSI